MQIREISVKEFNDFANGHKYMNFHQSISYALLKAEHGYEYEMIGYFNNDQLLAAALVLVKILDGYLYAYVPEGFLIDYDYKELFQEFTKDLINYYKKEQISFIKINPPIIVGEINPNTKMVKYNENVKLVSFFKELGYQKLDENMNFENVLPRINAIINLKDFSALNLTKNTKNKIRKGIRKGLTFEKTDSSQLNILNEFIKRKINKTPFYYNDYFNIFKRDNNIDFFLVSIDYQKYVLNSQDAYQKELKKNELLNHKVKEKPGTRNINKKMNSDKTLLAYKDDVSIASKNFNLNKKDYIAGALVIKHGNMATILISGYDKKYKDFAPNYFLYANIINYYLKDYELLNLNGITADLSKTSKYKGLNDFKLGFKPNIYEYIGEFDLIINQRVYNHLKKKGFLKKEFNQN